MGFLNKFICIILLVVIFDSLSLASIIHYDHGLHPHHHHHHGSHKCRIPGWHSLSPAPTASLPSSATPSLWSETSLGLHQLDSDPTLLDPHPNPKTNQNDEFIPLKVEYSLPMDYDQLIKKELSVLPPVFHHHPHHHHHDTTDQYHFRSWDDDVDPSTVFRLKKFRNKKNKKKKIIPIVKDVYYQESPTDNTTPMSKIIVIEEPDSNPNSDPQKFQDEIDEVMEKQIVKTLMNSKFIKSKEHPLSNDHNSSPPSGPPPPPYEHQSHPLMFEPQSRPIYIHTNSPQSINSSTMPPILTIKDLHERLNQTLFSRIPNSNYSNNDFQLNHSFPNGTMIVQPIPFNNNNNQTSSYFSGSVTNYGSQDSYMKSNNFAYQNNGNNIDWIGKPNTTFNSNGFQHQNHTKLNEQMQLSGSMNRQWFSSSTTTTTTSTTTVPSVFYFTSHRTVNLNPTIRPTTTFLQSSSQFRKKIDPGDPYSTMVKQEDHQSLSSRVSLDEQKSNNSGLNVQWISSIIITFCVLMMLLIGIIVIYIYKNSISEHYNTITRRNPKRRKKPESPKEIETNRNDNQTAIKRQASYLKSLPGPSSSASSSSSSSSSSASSFPDFESTTPSIPPHKPKSTPAASASAVAPPPPPSPPPPFITNKAKIFPKKINAIKFNEQKCRNYFSRVHRWVPKRPPLPTDLLDQT